MPHVELAVSADELEGKKLPAVYVYEAPVRLWHWINAACITVLALSGWFISHPLPSVTGQASDHFIMGYIRFAHFAAGYIFGVGLLGRIYWAFVGNSHAQQIFFLPLFNGRWWKEVLHEISWYAFIAKEPKRYIGHNPLAQTGMFLLFTLPAIFMFFTGFALYSEGAGVGSWQDHLFGWVIPAMGGSQAVHSWHHLGMWVIVSFVMIHVYVAVREDIMSRQSIVSTMISGIRMFKD